MAANDSKPISVRVLFFGAARDAAGRGDLELLLSSPANVGSAFTQLRWMTSHRPHKPSAPPR